MAIPLADASDLAGFPGAPFDEVLVGSAAESVRREAGWHIAPPVAETVKVDGTGGCYLLVPSMRLSTVNEVRDMSGAEPIILDGVTSSTSGILYRAAGWPSGFRNIEVDITHGYDVCPPDLLPLIASLASTAGIDPTVAEQSAGLFRVKHTDPSALEVRTEGRWIALASYRLQPGA